MPEYIKAIPQYNFSNNYILFLLIKLLKIKTVKNYTDLIFKINKIFLESVYIFEKDLQIIKKELFYETYIEKIIMPDTILEIEDKAFMNCNYLKEVVISNSLTKR